MDIARLYTVLKIFTNGSDFGRFLFEFASAPMRPIDIPAWCSIGALVVRYVPPWALRGLLPILTKISHQTKPKSWIWCGRHQLLPLLIKPNQSPPTTSHTDQVMKVCTNPWESNARNTIPGFFTFHNCWWQSILEVDMNTQSLPHWMLVKIAHWIQHGSRCLLHYWV